MSVRPLTKDQLLTAMQHATGFVWTVPDAPSQLIAVQTDLIGSGRWGVFRHGVDDRSIWNGSDWITPVDAIASGHPMYGLDLQDALRQIPALVDQHAADHQEWQTRHAKEQAQAAELGEQIDEWLEPITTNTAEEVAA
jgi:hypothetical protein